MGVLIKEMVNIRNKVTFKIILAHFSMEKELVQFIDNPNMFLIQRCHMESQNERNQMETNTEEISLPETNVTINRSVHAFICSMDENRNGIAIIKDKFGEYAVLIDYKAREVFKQTTPSVIKCCYGFNHHRK